MACHTSLCDSHNHTCLFCVHQLVCHHVFGLCVHLWGTDASNGDKQSETMGLVCNVHVEKNTVVFAHPTITKCTEDSKAINRGERLHEQYGGWRRESVRGGLINRQESKRCSVTNTATNVGAEEQLNKAAHVEQSRKEKNRGKKKRDFEPWKRPWDCPPTPLGFPSVAATQGARDGGSKEDT